MLVQNQPWVGFNGKPSLFLPPFLLSPPSPIIADDAPPLCLIPAELVDGVDIPMPRPVAAPPEPMELFPALAPVLLQDFRLQHCELIGHSLMFGLNLP